MHIFLSNQDNLFMALANGALLVLASCVIHPADIYLKWALIVLRLLNASSYGVSLHCLFHMQLSASIIIILHKSSAFIRASFCQLSKVTIDRKIHYSSPLVVDISPLKWKLTSCV